MPRNADFDKIYNRFIKQYGEQRGKVLYFRFIKKKGYDDTKPLPGAKENKEKRCFVRGVELKEIADEFHVHGLIATDHVDNLDEETGIDIPDIIPKETLESFANQLNTTAEAGYHGIHHSEAEGKVYGEADVKNYPARVIDLTDGKNGLFVDTKYFKDNPEVVDIINQWKTGDLNSFSITYDTDGFRTTDFEWIDDKLVRVIGPDTKLQGYTAASDPVNPNAKATAYGFKEFKELVETKKPATEANNMTEEKPTEPNAQDNKTDEKPAEKPAEPATPPAEPKEEKESKSVTEFKEAILKSLKTELKEVAPANAPMNNVADKITPDPNTKNLEIKEKEFKEASTRFKDTVLANKGTRNEQYRACKEMKAFLDRNKIPIQNNSMDTNPETMGYAFEIKESDRKGLDYTGSECKYPRGCFSTLEMKENRLEMKGVPTTGSVTTDSDYSGAQTTYITALANYEQSPARYNDIYGPFIINQLNDEVTTWNMLQKDDFSNMSSIQFRARTGRNATAGTYGFGSEPGWDSKATLLKLNLLYVTSYVEIAAEWEAIELGRGAGGIDVFQTELESGSLDLMNYINGQIFGTGDGTAETAALGFEHLVKTHGSGATTLYGKNRSTNATLDSGGYDDLSSAPFTLDTARKMVEVVRVNGARREDLVFIMSLRQKRLFYQLIQDMQRIVPTSTRVGFTGQPELDGIPIFEDKVLDDGSKTDDIYTIDTRHTRIALKKAPTYVEMAQISLHRRGIIWMMWNLYCTAPNHNYWTYGAATS